MADGIEAKAVDLHRLQPELRRVEHFVFNRCGRIIQVRHAAPKQPEIVRAIAAVPNLLSPRAEIAGIGVAPDIPVTVRRVGRRRGAGEPGMLARRVVHHKIDDDFNAAAMRAVDQRVKIRQRAVIALDAAIVGDIVTVIARRLRNGHQPNAGHAEIGVGGGVAVVQIIQFLNETFDVADAITVAVVKTPDEDFVKDGVIPPVGFLLGVG